MARHLQKYKATARLLIRRAARRGYRVHWLKRMYMRQAVCHHRPKLLLVPQPESAMAFFLLAHEVAHAILPGHDLCGYAPELEADLWAMEQTKRTIGYVPATIERKVRQNTAKAAYYSIRGDASVIHVGPPWDLAALLRLWKRRAFYA